MKKYLLRIQKYVSLQPFFNGSGGYHTENKANRNRPPLKVKVL